MNNTRIIKPRNNKDITNWSWESSWRSKENSENVWYKALDENIIKKKKNVGKRKKREN